jgi:hypothetical protein
MEGWQAKPDGVVIASQAIYYLEGLMMPVFSARKACKIKLTALSIEINLVPRVVYLLQGNRLSALMSG